MTKTGLKILDGPKNTAVNQAVLDLVLRYARRYLGFDSRRYGLLAKLSGSK